jgi:predicted O-methyltransferase YrrM
MIFSQAVKYLNYILLSHHRKGHGIHSPFVYDLVSRVFRNKIDPDVVLKVEQVRQKMISDNRIISVKDLGSRSVSLKTNLRRVSGRLLSNLAAEFGHPLIIELGTSLGISAMYLAASCPDAVVCTVEGCPATASIARQNFVEAGFKNIMLSEGPFDEVLPGLANIGIKPGLVFIDGNHRKEPVIKYFSQLAELSDSKTIILIDDINNSKEMAEAWEEIKLHPKVSISVDLFRMGIIFFREGINHNNYAIRY